MSSDNQYCHPLNLPDRFTPVDPKEWNIKMECGVMLALAVFEHEHFKFCPHCGKPARDKPRYNHAFSIAFTVESNHPEGEDLTPKMISRAIHRRVEEACRDGELREAIDFPWDTYANFEGEDDA